MNRDELRSRTAITVATYALLSLAGSVSLILPDSVVPPSSSAAIPEATRPHAEPTTTIPAPVVIRLERGTADEPAPARYD